MPVPDACSGRSGLRSDREPGRQRGGRASVLREGPCTGQTSLGPLLPLPSRALPRYLLLQKLGTPFASSARWLLGAYAVAHLAGVTHLQGPHWRPHRCLLSASPLPWYPADSISPPEGSHAGAAPSAPAGPPVKHQLAPRVPQRQGTNGLQRYSVSPKSGGLCTPDSGLAMTRMWGQYRTGAASRADGARPFPAALPGTLRLSGHRGGGLGRRGTERL